MHKRRQQLTYVLFDLLAAALAWIGVFIFRDLCIEKEVFALSNLLQDKNFILGLIIIPLFWGMFYFLLGFYAEPYRKSRLREFFQTFFQSLFGGIVIFFFIFIDDAVGSYKSYYLILLVYFGLHFCFTMLPRFILSSITVRRILRKQFGYPSLVIGTAEKAREITDEILHNKVGIGFDLVGFVSATSPQKIKNLDCLGSVEQIQTLIQRHHITDVIIALEPSDHSSMKTILNTLKATDVYIKIMPAMYQLVAGQVKMNSILGVPLIEINQEIIPRWQWIVKRMMDVVLSLLVLFLCWPFYLIIALLIKLDSKGPVFYSQERIGRKGKSFQIYKFRSMRTDAEDSGPVLAKEHDARATQLGRFLRKTRIDEMPQFYNVLKGDMALVGPRPERQFFIDQIVKKAPHYTFLHRVRPGITSWGQVKYGYASDVDQMIERLKYDVLYIENMSLMVDLKILIYTVLIVLQSRGK